MTPDKQIGTDAAQQNSESVTELKAGADVDRLVLKNLSNTSNPDNWPTYDLAGRQPFKDKLKVVMKGLGVLLLILVVWAVGDELDGHILHRHATHNRGGPVFGVVILFMLAIAYIASPVITFRLGMRTTKKAKNVNQRDVDER